MAFSSNEQFVQDLRHGIPMRQRRALAKAITLLESSRPEHRLQADLLLTSLLEHTGRSLRIGISGVPGVGKSTFIEALGLLLIDQGHRLAVLAIDPSSCISGGSILGDKTRMEQLSLSPQAYIRPSPASGTLGGVAERTREAILLCEAARYDVLIIETVGVGQSETAVANMTDLFCLLQLPNAGDDLQAIKKGVMELADVVLINKADLDIAAATRAQAQITGAMRLFDRRGNSPSTPDARVMPISALRGQGVAEFWQWVRQFHQAQTDSGRFQSRRQQQSLAWMWEQIESGLRQHFRALPQVNQMLSILTQQVLQGQMPASVAARQLLALATAP